MTEREPITLSSGLVVRLFERIDEDGAEGPVARFRFVADDLAGRAQVTDELTELCEAVVLPELLTGEDAPERVILSLSDREVPFGTIDREATQFFEAFRIVDGRCEWEP